MKHLFTILISILPSIIHGQIGHGTCVAFAMDPHIIYVAVDSKTSYSGGRKATYHQKIHCSKGLFGVLAGTATDTAGKYIFENILDYISDRYSSFDERLLHLRDTLKNFYSSIYPTIIKDTAEFPTLKKEISATLIWQIENGELKMTFEKYIPHHVGEKWETSVDTLITDRVLRLGLHTTKTFGSIDSAERVLAELGNSSIGARTIQSNPYFHVDGFFTFDLESIQNQLYYTVYVESKKHPDKVGGTLSEIAVQTDGTAKWFYNDCQCDCFGSNSRKFWLLGILLGLFAVIIGIVWHRGRPWKKKTRLASKNKANRQATTKKNKK